jgi:D-alanyl-D-alanine carboxypeptidase (penicillin-binding protein 5/6)
MARRRRRRARGVLVLAAATVLCACGSQAAAPTGSAPRPAVRRPRARPEPAGPRLAMARFHKQPRAGILVELDSGRVLWQRHPTAVLPIASLTKMMTALLVVRRAHATARVLITKQALAYRGSGVGLLPKGRRVPLEPLLYGLLLPSGNDAAIALAQHVAGTVTAFVREMNAEASALRLGCTHYTSPDGYDDENHSCAADLARLAAVDLAQPRIARIVSQRSAVLAFPIKGGKLYLYNNNPLLRSRFPGITGMKTGETIAAGLCLVATAQRGHIRLVSVLLHSPDLARQSAALLEAGFRAEHAGGAP